MPWHNAEVGVWQRHRCRACSWVLTATCLQHLAGPPCCQHMLHGLTCLTPCAPAPAVALATGLSPLTVIATVREMCEKLKVVVGSDTLSKEAQVDGLWGGSHQPCKLDGHGDWGWVYVLGWSFGLLGRAARVWFAKAGRWHTPSAPNSPTPTPRAPPIPLPQRNATLLWFCLLRSTFASKRVLSEYKLSDEAFRWLAGEVSNK